MSSTPRYIAALAAFLDEGNTLAHGHPGMQVLPSALALAQESGCSARDFLTAFAIGYAAQLVRWP